MRQIIRQIFNFRELDDVEWPSFTDGLAAVYDAGTDRMVGSAFVSSFNGRAGVVSPAAGDYAVVDIAGLPAALAGKQNVLGFTPTQGSGTTGKLPQWSAATTLADSIITAGASTIAIGTTINTDRTVNVVRTGLDLSTFSTSAYGGYFSISGGNPNPSIGQHQIGLRAEAIAETDSTAGAGGPVGMQTIAQANFGIPAALVEGQEVTALAAGAVTNVYGQFVTARSQSASGIVTNAYGNYTQIQSSIGGLITNAHGQKTIIAAGSNKITKAIGLLIDSWTGTSSESYGIYLSSAIDIGATRYAIYSLSTSPSLLTGNLTLSGLLKLGTTPITINDAAGKILSAALNTVAVAQGGTGVVTLTGLVKGNGTSAFTAAEAGTDYVAPGAVTASGLTMNAARLLGRSTAGVGPIEEIVIGANLTLSGGTLSASGGGGATINPTNSVIPYRSSSSAFSDSPLTVSGNDVGLGGSPSSIVGYTTFDLKGPDSAHGGIFSTQTSTGSKRGIFYTNSSGLNIEALTSGTNINFIQGGNVVWKVDSSGALVAVNTASSITTADPTSGIGPAWKLGSKKSGAVTLDTGNYVEISIGGAIIKFMIGA